MSGSENDSSPDLGEAELSSQSWGKCAIILYLGYLIVAGLLWPWIDDSLFPAVLLSFVNPLALLVGAITDCGIWSVSSCGIPDTIAVILYLGVANGLAIYLGASAAALAYARNRRYARERNAILYALLRIRWKTISIVCLVVIVLYLVIGVGD